MSHNETQEQVEAVASRYRELVQGMHPNNPKEREDFAKSLLSLVNAFRPDCREAMHNVYLDMFYKPTPHLPPAQPRERPRGVRTDSPPSVPYGRPFTGRVPQGSPTASGWA